MHPVARTLTSLSSWSSAGLATAAALALSAVLGAGPALADPAVVPTPPVPGVPVPGVPVPGVPVPGVPAVPLPPVLPDASATPCAVTVRACFSVSQRRAWLTDGAGHVTYGPVPALGGTSSYPTPTGTFRVTFKDAHHVSNLFNPGSMPNSVFFAPAVAFHQGSLSERSHGCVHLSKGASQTFFGALRPGDQVQVVR